MAGLLKKLGVYAGSVVAPKKLATARKTLRLEREIVRLKRKTAQASTLAEQVDLVLSCGPLRPTQKRTEFVQLLKLIKSQKPRRFLEIGGCRGGSMMLFCGAAAPDAHLTSIDVEYRPEQIAAYPNLAGPGQRLECVAADSHSKATQELVARKLAGHKLDVLFIDGDRSYEGVRRDFEMYAPFVRPGGLVAFHDVVWDYKTRHGRETASRVGEVPRFWAELRQTAGPVHELIDDPEQDGFGIGVLFWTGQAIELPKARAA